MRVVVCGWLIEIVLIFLINALIRFDGYFSLSTVILGYRIA